MPVHCSCQSVVDIASASKRELLMLILSTLQDQGVTLTRLDDAVTNYLTEVDATVADLRDKLEKAQADDATAADVAADVEENIARLENAASALRGEVGEQPAEGAPVEPAGPEL